MRPTKVTRRKMNVACSYHGNRIRARLRDLEQLVEEINKQTATKKQITDSIESAVIRINNANDARDAELKTLEERLHEN